MYLSLLKNMISNKIIADYMDHVWISESFQFTEAFKCCLAKNGMETITIHAVFGRNFEIHKSINQNAFRWFKPNPRHKTASQFDSHKIFVILILIMCWIPTRERATFDIQYKSKNNEYDINGLSHVHSFVYFRKEPACTTHIRFYL